MSVNGRYQMPDNNMDKEPVVKEFITRPPKYRKRRRKRKRFLQQYKGRILFGCYVLFWVICLLLGILLFKLPLLTVISILLIEAALACCLHDVELWLHGLAVLISILTGVLFHAVVFMICGAVVYIAGIGLLYWIKRE